MSESQRDVWQAVVSGQPAGILIFRRVPYWSRLTNTQSYMAIVFGSLYKFPVSSSPDTERCNHAAYASSRDDDSIDKDSDCSDTTANRRSRSGFKLNSSASAIYPQTPNENLGQEADYPEWSPDSPFHRACRASSSRGNAAVDASSDLVLKGIRSDLCVSDVSIKASCREDSLRASHAFSESQATIKFIGSEWDLLSPEFPKGISGSGSVSNKLRSPGKFPTTLTFDQSMDPNSEYTDFPSAAMSQQIHSCILTNNSESERCGGTYTGSNAKDLAVTIAGNSKHSFKYLRMIADFLARFILGQRPRDAQPSPVNPQFTGSFQSDDSIHLSVPLTEEISWNTHHKGERFESRGDKKTSGNLPEGWLSDESLNHSPEINMNPEEDRQSNTDQQPSVLQMVNKFEASNRESQKSRPRRVAVNKTTKVDKQLSKSSNANEKIRTMKKELQEREPYRGKENMSKKDHTALNSVELDQENTDLNQTSDMKLAQEIGQNELEKASPHDSGKRLNAKKTDRNENEFDMVKNVSKKTRKNSTKRKKGKDMTDNDKQQTKHKSRKEETCEEKMRQLLDNQVVMEDVNMMEEEDEKSTTNKDETGSMTKEDLLKARVTSEASNKIQRDHVTDGSTPQDAVHKDLLHRERENMLFDSDVIRTDVNAKKEDYDSLKDLEAFSIYMLHSSEWDNIAAEVKQKHQQIISMGLKKGLQTKANEVLEDASEDKNKQNNPAEHAFQYIPLYSIPRKSYVSNIVPQYCSNISNATRPGTGESRGNIKATPGVGSSRRVRREIYLTRNAKEGRNMMRDIFKKMDEIANQSTNNDSDVLSLDQLLSLLETLVLANSKAGKHENVKGDVSAARAIAVSETGVTESKSTKVSPRKRLNFGKKTKNKKHEKVVSSSSVEYDQAEQGNGQTSGTTQTEETKSVTSEEKTKAINPEQEEIPSFWKLRSMFSTEESMNTDRDPIMDVSYEDPQNTTTEGDVSADTFEKLELKDSRYVQEQHELEQREEMSEMGEETIAESIAKINENKDIIGDHSAQTDTAKKAIKQGAETDLNEDKDKTKYGKGEEDGWANLAGDGGDENSKTEAEKVTKTEVNEMPDDKVDDLVTSEDPELLEKDVSEMSTNDLRGMSDAEAPEKVTAQHNVLANTLAAWRDIMADEYSKPNNPRVIVDEHNTDNGSFPQAGSIDTPLPGQAVLMDAGSSVDKIEAEGGAADQQEQKMTSTTATKFGLLGDEDGKKHLRFLKEEDLHYVGNIKQRIVEEFQKFAARNIRSKFIIPGNLKLYEPPEASPLFISRKTLEKIDNFLGFKISSWLFPEIPEICTETQHAGTAENKFLVGQLDPTEENRFPERKIATNMDFPGSAVDDVGSEPVDRYETIADSYRELKFYNPLVPITTYASHRCSCRDCRKTVRGRARKQRSRRSISSGTTKCGSFRRYPQAPDAWANSDLDRSSLINVNGRFYSNRYYRKKITLKNMLSLTTRSAEWKNVVERRDKKDDGGDDAGQKERCDVDYSKWLPTGDFESHQCSDDNKQLPASSSLRPQEDVTEQSTQWRQREGLGDMELRCMCHPRYGCLRDSRCFPSRTDKLRGWRGNATCNNSGPDDGQTPEVKEVGRVKGTAEVSRAESPQHMQPKFKKSVAIQAISQENIQEQSDQAAQPQQGSHPDCPHFATPQHVYDAVASSQDATPRLICTVCSSNGKPRSSDHHITANGQSKQSYTPNEPNAFFKYTPYSTPGCCQTSISSYIRNPYRSNPVVSTFNDYTGRYQSNLSRGQAYMSIHDPSYSYRRFSPWCPKYSPYSNYLYESSHFTGYRSSAYCRGCDLGHLCNYRSRPLSFSIHHYV